MNMMEAIRKQQRNLERCERELERLREEVEKRDRLLARFGLSAGMDEHPRGDSRE